jgi:dolichyl-phosphate-mannose-protein mannosyltransferase
VTTNLTGMIGQPSVKEHSRSRPTAYILIALVLALTFVMRFHLRNLPLERDEGEYAYSGQLLLQGIPPYQMAYNMKLPGTYMVYALFLAVFGETPAGVHLGLLVANLAAIVLVFLLGLRVADEVTGVVAASSYALLSASPSVLGFAGHAAHFVVLAALAGILALLLATEKNSIPLFLASGIFLGLAFIMKQPGALFIAFGGFYLIRTELSLPADKRSLAAKLATFIAGAVLPLFVICCWLWGVGVFKTFWFWTVSYAAQYATNSGLGEGAHQFVKVFPAIVTASLWIWLIALFGLGATFWDYRIRHNARFLVGFLLFSFLAVCPDFLFREHYFILSLPSIALLAGVGVSAGARSLQKFGKTGAFSYVPALIFILALAASFYRQKYFFLETDAVAVCRRIYGGNPFPEAMEISEYIRQHTSANAKIAVLGSEPEIYFYSHRLSATGYIYTYGLMEAQKYALQMQEQMISEIQSAHPEVLVFVNVSASWLPRPHSNTLIYSWAQKYIQEHYELAGLADIHQTHTDYRWEDNAKSYHPRSNAVVFVFRRKAS